MAVDMFLKLGTIEGESADTKHGKEIDLLAWSWGMSQSGTTHTGTGGGAGKVSVQDLSITKYVDASTANLMQACCDGSHFDTAKLTVRKAGKDALEYFKLTLKTVIITSVTTGAHGADDRMQENVTLNFAEYKVEYTPQGGTGSGAASKEVAWKIAGNSAA